MLQNAYLLAKIGADTAENEQHFAEILPKIGNYPTGPAAARTGTAAAAGPRPRLGPLRDLPAHDADPGPRGRSARGAGGGAPGPAKSADRRRAGPGLQISCKYFHMFDFHGLLDF